MNDAYVKPNAKGQFVIPHAMRKAWGITPDTYLQVIDTPDVGIVIRPSTKKSTITDEEYLAILDETRGAWAGEDWPKRAKEQRRLAIKEASQMRKNSW